MPHIESEVMRSIKMHCDRGNRLVTMKEYSFAISKYIEALNLVPDPKKDYKAATYIYTSIGKAYWMQQDYNNAGTAFFQAVRSVGGDKVPQIALRLGQCLFECGESKYSIEYLCRAYSMEGEKIFEGENPKYFKAIKSMVEGAPDDDEFFDDDYGNGDYYLVDNMLGTGSRPVEFDDYLDVVEDDGNMDYPDEASDGYDGEYAEVEFGADNYYDDGAEVDMTRQNSDDGYGVAEGDFLEAEGEEAGIYFDGNGDDDYDGDYYDGDDYDDYDQPRFGLDKIKELFEKFLALFR